MRLLPALALALLVVPFTGCLKSKDTFTLNKDGSGSIVSTYSVDMTKARELASAVAMFMGQGSPEEIAKTKDVELLNFEHPNWFKAAAAKVEGYSVTSATQSITAAEAKKDEAKADEAKADEAKKDEAKKDEAKKDEAKKDDAAAEVPKTRSTRIEATFDSLAAAAQADAFAITAITLSKVAKSEKLPNGAWKLVVKDAFSGLDASQTGGMDPSQMLPMFEGQLKKGLAVTLCFTVPGKILETNGKKSEDGRTATTLITYDRVLEGKDLALNIVFEATDDMKLKPFSSSPDIMSLANRLMGKPPAGMASKPKEGGGAADDEETGGEKKADEGKDAPAKDAAPKKDAPVK
jgi:hypothetical protein